MNKINNLSLPVVVLIASVILGGFYFASQVAKQKSIERQQKQEQLAEQKAKEEAEEALNVCLTNAEANYHDRWVRECKVQGKLTSKCIDICINELGYDDYLEKCGLTSEEYVKQRNLTPDDPNDPKSVRLKATADYIFVRPNECSCRLPRSTADRLDESLEEDKEECFKKYPQK